MLDVYGLLLLWQHMLDHRRCQEHSNSTSKQLHTPELVLLHTQGPGSVAVRSHLQLACTGAITAAYHHPCTLTQTRRTGMKQQWHDCMQMLPVCKKQNTSHQHCSGMQRCHSVVGNTPTRVYSQASSHPLRGQACHCLPTAVYCSLCKWSAAAGSKLCSLRT